MQRGFIYETEMLEKAFFVQCSSLRKSDVMLRLNNIVFSFFYIFKVTYASKQTQSSFFVPLLIKRE